uniref:Uncharacterized protein n=1 Tax=Elaeophora elaphi TaxID=1147741 RepID=A0A0R3RKF5_9BILA
MTPNNQKCSSRIIKISINLFVTYTDLSEGMVIYNQCEMQSTPMEASLKKKGGDMNLEQLNDFDEKRPKNKSEREDEDDTLYNVDPLMPDLDLPSLHLNAKTE